MRYVKASTLYDGTGSRKNVYIGFDKQIEEITEKKPDGDIIAEGVVTPINCFIRKLPKMPK